MRRGQMRSRILKKLPGPPGGNRMQKGRRSRCHRSLVRRPGPHRTEEQDRPTLGETRNASFRTERPAPASSQIFGAIRPKPGNAVGPILPKCNTEAMQLHLGEIASDVAPGPHAVLLLDQAGWRKSGKLDVPLNLTLLPSQPNVPSSTRSRMSGSSCTKTGRPNRVLRRLEQRSEANLGGEKSSGPFRRRRRQRCSRRGWP